MALRVGVLGPVTAWLDDREVSAGQPRQRALLALLASRANRVVSRDELVEDRKSACRERVFALV